MDTDQAAAGLSWHDVAKAAYAAYAASIGNRNFRGDLMPDWDVLPAAIKTAWEAAVREVARCLGGGALDESCRG
jgi:hypothetical protein